jgi:hypothetical protein
MNLEHFYRQVQEMNARVAGMQPGQGEGPALSREQWEETATALDTAMGELHVTEE